jgi:hypothetical protein
MEAVKTLEGSREGLLGVRGAERSDSDGGNWRGPLHPGDVRLGVTGSIALYNRRSREVLGEVDGRRRRP